MTTKKEGQIKHLARKLVLTAIVIILAILAIFGVVKTAELSNSRASKPAKVCVANDSTTHVLDSIELPE